MPFYLEVLQVKECAPTPFVSIFFTFGLAFESIKEFGGASSKDFTFAQGFCQDIKDLQHLKGKSHIVQLINFGVSFTFYLIILLEIKLGHIHNWGTQKDNLKKIFFAKDYFKLLLHLLFLDYKGLVYGYK